MSYLALARKYRPGDFESIISQHHVTATLRNAVKSGRISHAYLFCGPRGTGKTTTARVLAKALNCEKGPTPDPCGVCNVCKEITTWSSPDVFEIDAASNRGIDDIRELRENVRYSPVGGRYKIYIIDEVHRLTKEAFDALLKTLEEPPAHVIFIFATTEPQALPPTILSRTQRYDFKRIPVSSLAEAVNSVAHKEGLSIDANAALLVAKKADGSLRDALSLLDQLSSFADGAITAEQTAEILGLVKTELLAKISEAIIGHESKEELDLFGEFVKAGGDAQELAEALSSYMRTLLLIKNGVDDVELLELDIGELESARSLIADIDAVDLLRYFTVLADYKSSVKQGQDPIYSFEATLVKMSAMDRAVKLESLLNKLPDIPSTKSPTTKETKEAPKAAKPDRAVMYPDTVDYGPIPNDSFGDETHAIEPAKIDGPLNLDSIAGAWPGFCEAVARSNKAISGHLRLCKPSRFENGQLTLALDSTHALLVSILSKSDKKRLLETSLKGYFNTEIRVTLTLSSAAAREASEPLRTADPDTLFEGAPNAKELFDRLGGEIVGN